VLHAKIQSLAALPCLLFLAPSCFRGQSEMPVVFSANNSADYSTTLAQGSLFVIFGYNLGPPNLVQVSSFPLPNLLADTSVTVQSGKATLVSTGQRAASLLDRNLRPKPSNQVDTPPGIVLVPHSRIAA
jgi:hypothetical protein